MSKAKKILENLDEDGEICSGCNGSGEGMHEGSKCSTCGGSGIHPSGEDGPDDDYEYDRWKDEQE